MASLSLGVGGPGGAIGVRGGAELEPAVPKGRLSKLWYLVRMIYNNNFTRLKHTYMYMYHQYASTRDYTNV